MDIVLKIVRESVARRLGLKWQPVEVSDSRYNMQLSKEYNVEDDELSAQDDKKLAIRARRNIIQDLAYIVHNYAFTPENTTNACHFLRKCEFHELFLLAVYPDSVHMLQNVLIRYLGVNFDTTVNSALRPEVCFLTSE